LSIAQKLNLNEVRYKTNLALSRTHENAGNAAAALVNFQAFHQTWQNIHGPQATRRIQKVLTGREIQKTQRINLQRRNVSLTEGKNARQNVSLPPRKLKQIVEAINRNLEQKFVLDEMAQIAGLNRHYFARSFKQSTGKTPHQFLLERRVSMAQNLLQTSNLPIVEIAYQCGFSSQAHLTTQFRLTTGFTPHQFRQSL